MMYLQDNLANNIPNWEELSPEEKRKAISQAYNMGDGGYINAFNRAEKTGREIKLPPETKNHSFKVEENYKLTNSVD